jgi:hypothetical protein
MQAAYLLNMYDTNRIRFRYEVLVLKREPVRGAKCQDCIYGDAPMKKYLLRSALFSCMRLLCPQNQILFSCFLPMHSSAFLSFAFHCLLSRTYVRQRRLRVNGPYSRLHAYTSVVYIIFVNE